MNEGRQMKSVDVEMRSAVADGVFPGGVLLVSRRGDILFHEAYGQADIFTGRPVTRDTVFDLASLTKPLATTLAVMKLEEQQKLGVDRSVGEIIPEFRDAAVAAVTVRQLLNHTSGLPDYQPYFEQLRLLPESERKQALRTLLVKEAPVYPAGTKTLYSDVGFMILNWVTEALSRKRLDCFVQDEIYTPLGIQHLFFIDLAVPPVDRNTSHAFAATEQCPWRKKVLTGEVHDDNAFIVGGIAGQAGLFGTAGAVGRLLMVLQQLFHGCRAGNILAVETVRRYLTDRQDGTRVLGFDTPDPVNASCGHYFSRQTVGHLGFTGTSFWMDLEKEVNIILLTNRVHPARKNVRIREFRPIIHDMVMKNI